MEPFRTDYGGCHGCRTSLTPLLALPSAMRVSTACRRSATAWSAWPLGERQGAVRPGERPGGLDGDESDDDDGGAGGYNDKDGCCDDGGNDLREEYDTRRAPVTLPMLSLASMS
jgi:hypothetical protein